jgi:DNA mismatch repair protein MutS
MSKFSNAIDDNIYSEYFKNTKENQEKYGKKTVVLMQVGSFLEVYGIKTSRGDIIESQIEGFTEICQLNIAEKKSMFGNKGQIVMAGFGVLFLDKYLPKIIEGGYIAAIYLQEPNPKNKKQFIRTLHKVYSPGTFMSCETDSSPQITNNIMCIWIHKSKPLINIESSKIKDFMICGISVVNIFTGKSYIFQYQCPFLLNNTSFDELERSVSVFNPSEILFISPFDSQDLKRLMQFSGINSQTIHAFNSLEEENVKIKNCSSERYIKQILTKFYSDDVYNICSEFHENIIATQSYCFLLNFIQEQNPDLVRKISIPLFNNTSDRLILANHTLMQLNIIEEGKKEKGQYSCVMNFMNKCCSAIGKRKIQYQITNPTNDEEWLNKEYEMISNMLKPEKYSEIENYRKLLLQIRDIEKIMRQILIKKVYPSSIAHLYKTIEIVYQIHERFINDNEISDYLCNEFLEQGSRKYINEITKKIINFLNEKLFIDICKKSSSITNFDENIIKKGVSIELDSVIFEYEKFIKIFHHIKEKMNGIMQKHDNSYETEFIKVHETDKSGVTLQITTKRSQTLKILLDKITESSFEIEGVIIDFKEIKFSKAGSSTTNMDIEHPVLNLITKKMLKSKEIMNELIKNTYFEIINEIEKDWLEDIENLVKYIGKIDVLQSKAYLAKNYNYCKPNIIDSYEKSFVEAIDLRHCLIEQFQQNEIYITNTVSLGKNNENGILLYGTNAVGKTSLIRALGIAIIMAQSGFYVPCSQFHYKPYTAIYSRILGNDNIFKGLSTFAVEMSELRVILKTADENSLILGDELCSGTETESALSIFVAGLMKLCEKKASFIFATHFHEITSYNEIIEMKEILLKHMTVRYDRELDCLVYDRKLKEGSGPRMYGLEVCKSLYLDEEFLDLAHSIREKYFPNSRGELSNNTTIYNSNKIRGICEICNKEIAKETHHLTPQKKADTNGFIGSFHKNHSANLASVCNACHDNIHKNDIKLIKKKTTKGMKIIEEK